MSQENKWYIKEQVTMAESYVTLPEMNLFIVSTKFTHKRENKENTRNTMGNQIDYVPMRDKE